MKQGFTLNPITLRMAKTLDFGTSWCNSVKGSTKNCQNPKFWLFLDLVFASLDNVALPNWGLLLTPILHSERPKRFDRPECNRVKGKGYPI